MRRALLVAVFGLAVAGATLVAGWWMVPVLAAAWVRLLPSRPSGPTTCALGAACGWGLLLAWQAAHGPVTVLARRVGGVFHLPGWAFIALTLLFASLLAATAAALARGAPNWVTQPTSTPRHRA